MLRYLLNDVFPGRRVLSDVLMVRNIDIGEGRLRKHRLSRGEAVLGRHGNSAVKR